MTMEIPVSQLKQALQGLGRVAPRSAPLHVLGCAKLQARDGLLTATATDLDQYAHYHFDTPCSDQDTFVIALKELSSLAQADSDSRLRIDPISPTQLNVTRQVAGRAITSTVEAMEPGEWPDLPATVKTQSVSDAFLANVRRLTPFASDDASRHVLNSVFLDVSQASHYMVATDGRRLTSLNSVSFPFKESHILPTRKFLSWSKLEGPFALGATKVNEARWIQLDAGPWTYLTRTVEGSYPNWRQVIPSSHGSHAISFGEEDVELMRKVLPTLAGAESRPPTARLRGINGKLMLGGKADGQKEWTELELTHTRCEGADGMIQVNRQFLLEALDAGFRQFRYEDSMNPLHATDPQGGVHVLMPIKLDSDEAEPTTAPETAPEPVQAVHKAAADITKEPITRKERSMSEQNKPDASALDRLLAAFESAKQKLREAQASLGDIALAVKDAVREDRQRQAEIVAVRAGLHKLQAIRV